MSSKILNSSYDDVAKSDQDNIPSTSTQTPRNRSRLKHSIDLTSHPTTNQSTTKLTYPYSFNLFGHRSCVNAIQFSLYHHGRCLASAGDDNQVLIWDTFKDFNEIRVPLTCFKGPLANVFSLDFTVDGKRLLATGLDSYIYIYDLEHPSLSSNLQKSKHQAYQKNSDEPLQVIALHSSSCRRVTCHPEQPEGFLSASEDGTVIEYDLRLRTSSQGSVLLQNRVEYSDVLWNPISSHLFATSTSHQLKLYDRRMLGSDPTKNLSASILTYSTNLIMPKPRLKISKPEISSISFDESGQLLSIIMSRWYPTLYSLNDPHPIAVLKSPNYKDSCTIKHGSFSTSNHSRNLHFATGSDDFNGYDWKLPSIGELKEERNLMKGFSDGSTDFPEETIGYGKDPVTIPKILGEPEFILSGHKSIPNTIKFHPSLPFIVTSGIESSIKVHTHQSIHITKLTILSNRKETQLERTSDAEKSLDGQDRSDDLDELSNLSEADRLIEKETLEIFDQYLSNSCDDQLVWIKIRAGDDSDESGSDDDDDDDDSDDDDDD